MLHKWGGKRATWCWCRRLMLFCMLTASSVVGCAAQPCPPGWCKTFPATGLKYTPPFSCFWNKLSYIPDVGRFFLYTSDGIYTFSNSWWSYAVLGQVATANPWLEETTSGTTHATVTDNSKGFLESAVSSTDQTITVGAGQGASFHPDPSHGGVLIIDVEEIGYASSNLSKDTFSRVLRGIRGTTPAPHAVGALVNAGAPFPQSRREAGLVPVNDHIPDRHPFLSSAYDSRRHQLVQAGGIIELNKKTDTWSFCFEENQFCSRSQLRVWSRLGTDTPVPGRADAAMTYDPDDDVMILYGGQNVGRPRSDTWLLCFQADPQVSGHSVGCPGGRRYPDWVEMVTTGSPGPRLAHAIVYDAYHHRAVLFGGISGTLPDPQETWIYSPQERTWKNAKASGQSPRSFRRPAMTYDSTRHHIVLYEGPVAKASAGVLGGLYVYDVGTNTWELTSVAGGPVPTSPADQAHGRLSLAYDPARDTFVASELAVPYGIAVWELKGAELDKK